MTLQGTAFLAMWHDIAAAGEPEYNLWHTREHMPERVSIPGFDVGRRYVDWNLPMYRYFTLYEGRTLGVFSSDAYLDRLNAPTAWSNRIQPYFLNFIRCACQTIETSGRGIGGALLTSRLYFTQAGAAAFTACATDLAKQFSAFDGVTGVHIGVADPSVTSVMTAETELKKQAGEAVFDGVVMVEGIGRRELEAVLPRVTARLTADCGVGRAESAVYDLAYLLTPEQVTR
jgi:hypothetical protein